MGKKSMFAMIDDQQDHKTEPRNRHAGDKVKEVVHTLHGDRLTIEMD